MDELNLDFENSAVGSLPTATGDAHNTQFANLLGSILSIVMTIALLLLLFYMIWGAYTWITAGGDSSKLDEARNKMVNAVIGIVVLSATVAIFMFVQYFLGIEVLTFI